ncbi:hypothetical protein RHS04_07833 [Rhizoctonia solani]|uniref:Uncharacterized protein n=1 Tax=Rhizoctonia solani TaxID=456999 RepID=A0A8H7H380_9AGAM|nr:hypothetical protein RHS04_07833 [Rhizoctonia solani]
MSALKCKPAAGGYSDSSDLEEPKQVARASYKPKRPRHVPFVLSNLALHNCLRTPGFTFPRSSVSTSLYKRLLDLGTRGASVKPSRCSQSSSAANSCTFGGNIQFDGLLQSIKEIKRINTEEYARMEAKVDCLLVLITNLASVGMTGTPVELQAPAALNPSNTLQPLYSNPRPTPELIATVCKVVSETHLCVGKKKGNPEDNRVKEHTQISFYYMCAINAAKNAWPYFEDKHVKPNTLPVEFRDPVTGYCQPFPHWKALLIKQIIWVPTYIQRFKATIPNNGSKLSKKSQALTNEQIVALLVDGPFKTVQALWCSSDKTGEELKQMRATARHYQQSKQKANICSEYVKAIPLLTGPEYKCLYQPGYMLSEETDDEGNLVTLKPAHQACWESNLIEAIQIVEYKKSQPHGNCCFPTH